MSAHRIFCVALALGILCAAFGVVPGLLTGRNAVHAADPEAQKPEFVIDDYQFIWKVASAGDAYLEVFKTQDKTVICIGTKGGILHDEIQIPAQDAEAIATVLSKTDEYYNRLKGQKGKHEDTKAGGYLISFSTSEKGDFYVAIRPDEEFSMTTLVFDRKEALGISSTMAQSTKLCAFVDEKIKP